MIERLRVQYSFSAKSLLRVIAQYVEDCPAVLRGEGPKHLVLLLGDCSASAM